MLSPTNSGKQLLTKKRIQNNYIYSLQTDKMKNKTKNNNNKKNASQQKNNTLISQQQNITFFLYSHRSKLSAKTITNSQTLQ